MNEERELQWDDTIQKENDFVTIPEGDYTFMVESFERGRYTQKEGGRLPSCNMAILKLKIDSENGPAYIYHQLYLHSKMESRLSEFFMAIGQKKKGEALKMNWNAVPGSAGRAHITLDSDKEDPDKKFNHVKKFYPKEDKPVFKAGAF